MFWCKGLTEQQRLKKTKINSDYYVKCYEWMG